MGSATAWWLARRGIDVVLLEQFEQGHVRGSSHGGTRIFRFAYPDPVYVAMAQRALPLWRELEADADRELLVTTGGIDFGDPATIQTIVDALIVSRATHELLDAAEAAQRWPGFSFDGAVLYQPDAGRAMADATVRALNERAQVHGAELAFEEPARSISDLGDEVLVRTDIEEYRADAVVVTAGAWVAKLLAGVVELPPLAITQEQVFHFAPRAGSGPWPSFIHYAGEFVYGLETPGEGVKVAQHHTGVVTEADSRSFEIDELGRQRVIRHVTTWMPGLDPTPVSATTCLYTTTADESFIIERYGRVVVGSPCSGHGFKFTPLIGKTLADIAIGP